MTEPIDQATKERIEKEAEAFSHRSMSDAEYVSILSPKGCYIAGATVWAERLKQERDKVIDECIGRFSHYPEFQRIQTTLELASLKDKRHE